MRKLKQQNLVKIWDKSFIDITQNNVLGQGKTTKKTQKIISKVLDISDSTKQNILDLYFKFCEIKHFIRFKQYRLETSTNKTDESTVEFVSILRLKFFNIFRRKQGLNKLQEKCSEIDTVLYGKETNKHAKQADQSKNNDGTTPEAAEKVINETPRDNSGTMWLTNSEYHSFSPTPMFLYLMSNEQMIKLIRNVSGMNDKVLKKVQDLLQDDDYQGEEVIETLQDE